MTEATKSTSTRPRRVGVVESDAREKSRKVVVAFKAKHPLYGKYVRKRSVLQVHDENNESRLGDTIEIEECPPISKTKAWRLVRVIRRGIGE